MDLMRPGDFQNSKNLSETRSWSDFAPKAYWYICWEAKSWNPAKAGQQGFSGRSRWLLHNLG